jgi:hypothetical protein
MTELHRIEENANENEPPQSTMSDTADEFKGSTTKRTSTANNVSYDDVLSENPQEKTVNLIE